jgi:hypothetical protein
MKHVECLPTKERSKARRRADFLAQGVAADRNPQGFFKAVLEIFKPPEKWEHWDEDNTPHRPILFLHGETYKVDRLFDLPPVDRLSMTKDYIVSPQGTFSYLNHTLAAREPLSLFGPPGIVLWDAPVVIPTLVDMQVDGRTDNRFPVDTPELERASWSQVWMSGTPAEMISQRSGILRARGKVVIGGLGLGWFLRKVCEKESVTEVIVVERSQELLDWFGYDLCRRYPKVTDVICDDAFAQIGKHGDAVYLLDIWPGYDDARKDRRLKQADRKVGRRKVWAWGRD